MDAFAWCTRGYIVSAPKRYANMYVYVMARHTKAAHVENVVGNGLAGDHYIPVES